jgi:hypothetical protein
MVCPVCKEQNIKSTVNCGQSMSTLMGYLPYYDENGKYHDHDPNTITTYYSCSQGHHFSISGNGTCPSCDYGKDTKTIEVHDEAPFRYVS